MNNLNLSIFEFFLQNKIEFVFFQFAALFRVVIAFLDLFLCYSEWTQFQISAPLPAAENHNNERLNTQYSKMATNTKKCLLGK